MLTQVTHTCCLVSFTVLLVLVAAALLNAAAEMVYHVEPKLSATSAGHTTCCTILKQAIHSCAETQDSTHTVEVTHALIVTMWFRMVELVLLMPFRLK